MAENISPAPVGTSLVFQDQECNSVNSKNIMDPLHHQSLDVDQALLRNNRSQAGQKIESRENGDMHTMPNGKNHLHIHTNKMKSGADSISIDTMDPASNRKKINGVIHNEHISFDNGKVKSLLLSSNVKESLDNDQNHECECVSELDSSQNVSQGPEDVLEKGESCSIEQCQNKCSDLGVVLDKLETVAIVQPDDTCGLSFPTNEEVHRDMKGNFDRHGIEYIVYESEKQMPDIMRLITKDLSEPYSIYTYRYFIHNWPKLCFLAKVDDKCVGAIVCKLDLHKKMARRGYIAMLAVDSEYRRRQIGSTLVTKAIEAMIRDECDEVVLETEITNQGALRLYENLGFVRDKRLFRYYLNGVDALRLKLWLR